MSYQPRNCHEQHHNSDKDVLCASILFITICTFMLFLQRQDTVDLGSCETSNKNHSYNTRYSTKTKRSIIAASKAKCKAPKIHEAAKSNARNAKQFLQKSLQQEAKTRCNNQRKEKKRQYSKCSYRQPNVHAAVLERKKAQYKQTLSANAKAKYRRKDLYEVTKQKSKARYRQPHVYQTAKEKSKGRYKQPHVHEKAKQAAKAKYHTDAVNNKAKTYSRKRYQDNIVVQKNIKQRASSQRAATAKKKIQIFTMHLLHLEQTKMPCVNILVVCATDSVGVQELLH